MTLQLNTIHNGDALEILRTLPDNSIDAVVTDPPYGIEFMGKDWDKFSENKGNWRQKPKIGGFGDSGNLPRFSTQKTDAAITFQNWVEQWATECLRVLKPGGHLLAFGGTRMYHRLACGVENVGFEIRDMIEWLYLSGFPKSMDVGKQFDKQAGAEREVVGVEDKRGKFDGHERKSVAINHTWREAEGRTDTRDVSTRIITTPSTPLAKQWDGWGTALKPAHESIVMARKPLSGTVCANVEQYGTGAINVDGCRIGRTADDRYEYGVSGDEPSSVTDGIYGKFAERVAYTPHDGGRFPANCITTDDDEWYSKYFNVTPQSISKKATKKDRGEGNYHPTVKPIALMSWLVRLVTPPNGIVLDPFAGSGSTLVAAKREGFSYIGIEREQEYINIIHKRLA